MLKQQKKILVLSLAGLALVALILFPILKDAEIGSELKAKDPARYEMVMQRYNQAKKILSKDAKDTDGLVRLGTAYEEFGDDDMAISKYKEALAIDKANIMPWTNLAAIYKKRGKYEDAKNAYMQAIEIFPNDTQSYINLGNLYMDYNGGELDKVLEILGQGIEKTGDEAIKGVRDALEKMKSK